MKVLVYRKCSTCLKALKWLEVNQVVFDERPIKEENPSYEELKAWYEMSGLPLKKFFNTSGILYKQMRNYKGYIFPGPEIRTGDRG